MRFVTITLLAFSLMASVHPVLAQTYAPTTAGLRALVADDAAMIPPPEATKLRKQEADWEHGVGVSCTQNVAGQQLCYPDAKAMIGTIQGHIFKMDGYVFYDEEWSATTPSDLDENIPQIAAPLDAKARAFNSAVKADLQSTWMQNGGPPQTNPQSDDWRDVYLDYAINTSSLAGVISIEITLTDYMHGAMHPENQQDEFNWNLKERRLIIPADLFRQDTNWRLGIATAAIAAFANMRQDIYVPLTSKIMESAYSDPGSWGLLQSGLEIHTPQYLRCYMCATGVATIPWSALKPYLTPGGLVHNS